MLCIDLARAEGRYIAPGRGATGRYSRPLSDTLGALKPRTEAPSRIRERRDEASWVA